MTSHISKASQAKTDKATTDFVFSVRDLEKKYPSGVHALRGVTFNVRRGEFLVIIGLSGSGKSTLLRCLNRLHDPTAGQIFYSGHETTYIQGSEVRALRSRIGMIFQHFNLIQRASVLKNVLTGALSRTSWWRSILGLWSSEEIQKAYQNLQLVGIGDKAHYRASQLSGGQQQRVAIARALMQSPDVLLADEPVASLDPATCHSVMEHLQKINRDLGITVICNLHFLSLVRQYATRVIALKAGKILYDGSPQEIDDAWFERIYGEGARQVHIQ